MRSHLLAERTGFEPAITLLLYTLSKRAPSTTRPSLHIFNQGQSVPSVVTFRDPGIFILQINLKSEKFPCRPPQAVFTFNHSDTSPRRIHYTGDFPPVVLGCSVVATVKHGLSRTEVR